MIMRRILAAGVAAVALASWPSDRAAAAVPVTDSAVISAANKTASNTARQLTRLNDIKRTTGEILAAVGSSGQGQYDLNKNPDWRAFTSGGLLLQALQQFGPNLCVFESCENGKKPKDRSFRTIGEARAYIYDMLYAPDEGVSRSDVSIYARRRADAQREAGVAGYALALVSREYLADAALRAQKLDNIVNAAGDMRADIRANSAVMLAQHQQLVALQAIMTSMLERDAAAFIASEDLGYVLPPGTGGRPADDSKNGGLGGDLLESAAAEAADGAAKEVLEEANRRYGPNMGNKDGRAEGLLGTAGIAASKDKDAQSQQVFEEMSKRVGEKGFIDAAIETGAAVAQDERLGWLFESAIYGRDAGDFLDVVEGTGEPLWEVMLDVAEDMAYESEIPGAADVIWETRVSVEDGGMSPHDAALVALEIAADAARNPALAAAMEAALDVSEGGSVEGAIIDMMDEVGGDAGEAAAEVLERVFF